MKQIAALSTNEIARYAAKNVVMNHVDMITATSKGMALEAMKKRMMRGEVVRFAYMKKDGSVREAFGTLNAALCDKHINGRGQSPENWGCSCYFDVEKGQFRSFRWQNIIDILS